MIPSKTLTEEYYREVKETNGTITCTECGALKLITSIKQHLKNNHGYRYTEESPNFPVPMEEE